MRIFKRMKDIAIAEINGVLDKTEDPINMLNYYVQELDEEILKGQQALANQIFVEKKQKLLLREMEELIAKRDRQAKLAVERGEEQIAKVALQEKLIHEKKLCLYREQYETITNQTIMLHQKVNELKEKVNELKHRRILLLSRANVAYSYKQMNNTMISFDTDKTANGFARAEERILLMEAEAEASSYLSRPSQALPAHSIHATMEEEVQRELEKLKETTR